MLKLALVEVAYEELAKENQKISNSKVSVITGLQRRDIVRISKDEKEVSLNNVVTKIIGQWQIDSRFLNENETPKTLTISGKSSEFSLLVSSVSTDINPYAILFELERLGLINKTDKEATMTNSFKELSSKSLKEIIDLLTTQSSDLFTAVEENISKIEPVPNLHLLTEFDNIDPDAVPELRKWLLKKGSEFHNEALSKLSKHDLDLNPDLAKGKDGVRVSLSAYSKVEEVIVINTEIEE